MNIKLTHEESSPRLLLIFAGWAMDEHIFASVAPTGYDVAVAFDHRTGADTEQLEMINAYDEICVVGWSFGVIAATLFMSENPQLPYTARIAVNGTLCPVDDNFGIPEAIFRGTLDNLSPAVMAKFNRRMCGSGQRLAALVSGGWVQRPVDRLDHELRAIAAIGHCREKMNLWDIVVVGKRDMIIPADNQLRAWSGHPDVRCVDEPHLPDFDSLIDRLIVNKPLVARRFGGSVDSYDCEADVQRHVAHRLAGVIRERLAGRRVSDVLEVGCGTGFLTKELAALAGQPRLELWDLVAIPQSLPGVHRQCDAEIRICKESDESRDLIAGSSAVQWFNSAAAFVRHCHRVLRHDGLLALSTFDPDNFPELMPFLPSTPNYYSVGQWSRLMSEVGFREVSINAETMTREFDDTASLLRHLSRTGVNAVSERIPASVTRSILRSGIRRLTYRPLIVSGIR